MFYSSKAQFDKKAEKIIKTALRYKAIQCADDVQAILCANVFQDKNNYAICTNDSVIYGLAKMQMIVKTEVYAYSSITSIAQAGGQSFISIVVGGGLPVELKVMCDKEDALAFISYVSDKIGAKEKSAGLSTADEIKKYKELLDLGAITEEEYQSKKNQLLGL